MHKNNLSQFTPSFVIIHRFLGTHKLFIWRIHDTAINTRNYSSIIIRDWNAAVEKKIELARSRENEQTDNSTKISRSRFRAGSRFLTRPAGSIFAAFDKWSARGKNENYASPSSPSTRDCSRVNRIDNVPMRRYPSLHPRAPKADCGSEDKKERSRVSPFPARKPLVPAGERTHRCSTSVSPPREIKVGRGGSKFFDQSKDAVHDCVT